MIASNVESITQAEHDGNGVFLYLPDDDSYVFHEKMFSSGPRKDKRSTD